MASLEAIPSIYSSYDTAVSVQYSTSETEACTSSGHSWTIEFLQDFGDVPLLVSGVSKLTHSSSGTTASVAIEEAVAGTKESEDCSGRGLCDTDDRVCTCEPEFGTSNGYNEEVYPYVSSSLLRSGGRGDVIFGSTVVLAECTVPAFMHRFCAVQPKRKLATEQRYNDTAKRSAIYSRACPLRAKFGRGQRRDVSRTHP